MLSFPNKVEPKAGESICILLRRIYKNPKDKNVLDKVKEMYGNNPYESLFEHFKTNCPSCVEFMESIFDRNKRKEMIKMVRMFQAINSLTADMFERERVDLILCEGMKKTRRGKESDHGN